VHDPTTGELRRAERALAGATGALLLVRLLATTADIAAVLGAVGALARGSPRFLVEWVPWRAAASWATTTWWMSGTFVWTSNTSAGSSAVPDFLPAASITSTVSVSAI